MSGAPSDRQATTPEMPNSSPPRAASSGRSHPASRSAVSPTSMRATSLKKKPVMVVASLLAVCAIAAVVRGCASTAQAGQSTAGHSVSASQVMADVPDSARNSTVSSRTVSTTDEPRSSDPSTPNSQAWALHALKTAATDGEARFAPDGQVVVQLSSKWVGITDPREIAEDGSHTFRATDILDLYRADLEQYGSEIVLVRSTFFGKQLNYSKKPAGEPMWVVLDTRKFSDMEDARSWCSEQFPNLSGNDLLNSCYPRIATPPHD